MDRKFRHSAPIYGLSLHCSIWRSAEVVKGQELESLSLLHLHPKVDSHCYLLPVKNYEGAEVLPDGKVTWILDLNQR